MAIPSMKTDLGLRQPRRYIGRRRVQRGEQHEEWRVPCDPATERAAQRRCRRPRKQVQRWSTLLLFFHSDFPPNESSPPNVGVQLVGETQHVGPYEEVLSVHTSNLDPRTRRSCRPLTVGATPPSSRGSGSPGSQLESTEGSRSRSRRAMDCTSASLSRAMGKSGFGHGARLRMTSSRTTSSVWRFLPLDARRRRIRARS